MKKFFAVALAAAMTASLAACGSSTTETTTAEKATVSKETEPSGQNTKTEEKADSGEM